MRPARGFTYLGLVVLLMILGLVGAAGLKMGTLFERAAAEEELLEIGAQFSDALRSYAAATPEGQPKQPATLQDLLKDPRFPNPRRHLRKIFVDPMTGKAEWGIVYLADKAGVIGVYSLSNRKPLKVANFDIRFPNMENREHISDWKFLAAGGDGVPPVSLPGAGGALAAPSLFSDPAQAAQAAQSGLSPPAVALPPPPEPDPEGLAREEADADAISAQERNVQALQEAERQAADALREAEEAAAAAASSASQPIAPPHRQY